MVDLSEILRIVWKILSKTSETGYKLSAFAFVHHWSNIQIVGPNVDGPDQKLILKAKNIYIIVLYFLWDS